MTLLWHRVAIFNLGGWGAVTLSTLYGRLSPFSEASLLSYMHLNLENKYSPSGVFPHLVDTFLYHFQSSILWYQKDLRRKVHTESICSAVLINGLFIIMFLLNVNIFIGIFPIWKLKEHNNIIANSATGDYINFIVDFLSPEAGAHSNIDLAYSILHLVSAVVQHFKCLLMTRVPQSTRQIIIR